MNLLERNIKYEPKNFIQSMVEGEWDDCKGETLWNDDCKVDLKDGTYPMVFTNYSMNKISDIPKQKNTINLSKGNYTRQITYGLLSVEDGQIDLEELDNQIPKDYRKYNSHIFLEGFEILDLFGCMVIVPFFGS